MPDKGKKGGHRHPNSLATRRNGPPAPKGNTRPAKHFGSAEVTIPGLDEAREQIFNALHEARPIQDPADDATVELAARALARLRSCEAYIQKHGLFDRKGNLCSAAPYAEKATKTATQLLSKLGMDPVARAGLGVDLGRIRALDLATAMSEKDPDKRQELLRQAGVIDIEEEES